MNYNRYSTPPTRVKRSHKSWWLLIVLLVLIAGGSVYALHKHSSPQTDTDTTHTTAQTADTHTTNQTAQPAATECTSNTLAQNVVVSISKRHMWACNGSSVAYDAPVVTGMEYLAADLTPVGTYKIYAKETNQDLKGCDSTGCWNDPVSYWMPWLSNQYGIYGFHDATWRKPGDFGNIDPNSSNASHGCVELPLAAAKWLYGWAQVGTTVTIEA